MRLARVISTISLMISVSLAEDLQIGSKIPLADVKMKDISGKMVSLNDIKMENGLLVNFTCNTCPWVIRWQDRYNDLATVSNENKIGVVAINPNAAARDRGENMKDMKKFTKKYGHDFLYTLDESARLAEAFGAKYTPQIYLFDKSGKLVYKGAIDDNAAKRKKVKQHFLMDAIKSVGSGTEIALAETKAFGCSIKYPK